ncbi:MAG: SLC13 family permease, partial [Lachnospiraceae bacterium]
MKAIINFIKKETVLSIAALLAVVSMFFVKPDKGYIDYIDYRVLALLFCLMAVVAAMQSIGLFKGLGISLLRHAGTTRKLAAILIFLCFFCS